MSPARDRVVGRVLEVVRLLGGAARVSGLPSRCDGLALRGEPVGHGARDRRRLRLSRGRSAAAGEGQHDGKRSESKRGRIAFISPGWPRVVLGTGTFSSLAPVKALQITIGGTMKLVVLATVAAASLAAAGCGGGNGRSEIALSGNSGSNSGSGDMAISAAAPVQQGGVMAGTGSPSSAPEPPTSSPTSPTGASAPARRPRPPPMRSRRTRRR